MIDEIVLFVLYKCLILQQMVISIGTKWKGLYHLLIITINNIQYGIYTCGKIQSEEKLNLRYKHYFLVCSIYLHLYCLPWVINVIQDTLYTVTVIFLGNVLIVCFSYVVISYLIHLYTIVIIIYCKLIITKLLRVEAEGTILC